MLHISGGTCLCGTIPACENGLTCTAADTCACSIDEQCLNTTDTCNLVTGNCTCGGGPPCEDEECIDGKCGVSTITKPWQNNVSILLFVTVYATYINLLNLQNWHY